MTFEESLSIILAEMLAIRTRSAAPDAAVNLTDRMTTLDIFEMMIRIDDLALESGLSGRNPQLDHWAMVDTPSLIQRLSSESRSFTLATLLTLSPRGLAAVARHLSFFTWMEVARAANNLTRDQLNSIGRCELEAYLTGVSSLRPRLDLPLVFALPLPSVLRVVQSARFRLNLLKQHGYDQAMARYVRFFC